MDYWSEQKHFKNSNNTNDKVQIIKTTCLQTCGGLLADKVIRCLQSAAPSWWMNSCSFLAAASVCRVKNRARLVTESWRDAATLRRCVISSRRWWIARGAGLLTTRSLAFCFTVDFRQRLLCDCRAWLMRTDNGFKLGLVDALISQGGKNECSPAKGRDWSKFCHGSVSFTVSFTLWYLCFWLLYA